MIIPTLLLAHVTGDMQKVRSYHLLFYFYYFNTIFVKLILSFFFYQSCYDFSTDQLLLGLILHLSERTYV